MKDWIHLLIAAGVAALVGFASAALAAPERPTRGAADGAADASALRTAIGELKAEQARLAERLAALPAPTSVGENRIPAQDLDAAIAQFMARQDRPEVRASASPAAESESAALAERILSGTLSSDEVQVLWQRLRDEKTIDGVLAEIERLAGNAPNNPDLQNELGKAYIQKLFDAGIGPLAATYGEKADGAFDRALALDENHWEARFQKALALSNWPAFLGKQGESMHQFEILIEQQERGGTSAHDGYPETYLILGNLYAQNGETTKANELWQRGLARFPTHAGLRQRTEGSVR
jgi:hypothetical protein